MEFIKTIGVIIVVGIISLYIGAFASWSLRSLEPPYDMSGTEMLHREVSIFNQCKGHFFHPRLGSRVDTTQLSVIQGAVKNQITIEEFGVLAAHLSIPDGGVWCLMEKLEEDA